MGSSHFQVMTVNRFAGRQHGRNTHPRLTDTCYPFRMLAVSVSTSGMFDFTAATGQRTASYACRHANCEAQNAPAAVPCKIVRQSSGGCLMLLCGRCTILLASQQRNSYVHMQHLTGISTKQVESADAPPHRHFSKALLQQHCLAAAFRAH